MSDETELHGKYTERYISLGKLSRGVVTPRESLPNDAAYMGPFRHLGTSRSPTVRTINKHDDDTKLVMHKM